MQVITVHHNILFILCGNYFDTPYCIQIRGAQFIAINDNVIIAMFEKKIIVIQRFN